MNTRRPLPMEAADGRGQPGMPGHGQHRPASGGDYHDPRCIWQRHRQIASAGAILVRADRFIAWRHLAGHSDPRAVLAAAFSQILARPAA